MKTALICGVTGQDGAYLAKLLLEKGYRVIGTSRDALVSSFSNLQKLSIIKDIECKSMVLTDFRSTLQVLARTKPDEIYNLSGQSSVGLSFELPVETMESITVGTINLMESIRFLGGSIRLYNATSRECFGNTDQNGATETTPFSPRSPYAVAKAAAHWAAINYREAYGLFVSNGILFNHESPLRHERFVTRKIIASVCRIKSNQQKRVRLGNLAIYRDWGWAPEYVNAMWLILQHTTPDDFVIATGKAYSLGDFLGAAFAAVDLDWTDYFVHDHLLTRPSEILYSKGNPSKAVTDLGWRPTYIMPDVVRMMIEAEFS